MFVHVACPDFRLVRRIRILDATHCYIPLRSTNMAIDIYPCHTVSHWGIVNIGRTAQSIGKYRN